MSTATLSFVAENVAADITEHTPEFVVYLIAFGAGDPEDGGHHWNFSRCFDEDWGVCTVREVQEAVVYEGIESFRLHRSGVECVFDPTAAKETGLRELRIAFTIDDEVWRDLADTAQIVFRDCPCFALER
jgi:hypothetical protein